MGKRKIISLMILILVVVGILSFVWFFKIDKFVVVNNIPINGYNIKLNQHSKFYISRSSRLNDYTISQNDNIVLKHLLPDTTYYYKINNGRTHKIHTVKTNNLINGILANSKNKIFVFDNKLNLVYRINVKNVADSLYCNGKIYITANNTLLIYKNKILMKKILFSQKTKKLLKEKDSIFLSTKDTIYRIQDLSAVKILEIKGGFEDFDPYGSSFFIYKKNNGIYFKGLKILNIDDLSSMKAIGNYLFASGYKGEIFIVDLRTNKIIYKTRLNYHVFTICINGDKLYVGGNGYVSIFNIEDFNDISLSRTLNISTAVSDIKIRNNTMIIAEGNNGIALMDLKTYQTDYVFNRGIFAYAATIFDNKLFVIDPYEGINIYNKDLNKISQIQLNGFASCIYSIGKTLIVGVDKELLIYNDELKRISKVDLKAQPTDIKSKYQYIFVSEHNLGFQIINIENPSHPIVAETIYTNGTARNLDFENGTVYLANGKNIEIYDINMIINYEERSKINVNGNAFDCVVKDNILYIDNLKKSIMLYDVSDPAKPRFIGIKKVNYNIVSMEYYKDYIICASGFNGLYIYRNEGASLKLFKKISDGSYYNGIVPFKNGFIILKGESGFDFVDKNFDVKKSVDWIFIYSAKVF